MTGAVPARVDGTEEALILAGATAEARRAALAARHTRHVVALDTSKEHGC